MAGSTEGRLAGANFISRPTSPTPRVTTPSSSTPRTGALDASQSSSPVASPITSTVTPGPVPDLRNVMRPPAVPRNNVPRNPADRNASVVAGKRRVQLRQRAKDATPPSYRPARLYLNRLSPLPTSPRASVHMPEDTPWPPTPPVPEAGLNNSLPSDPDTSSPRHPPLLPALPPLPTVTKPPRHCLPRLWSSTSPRPPPAPSRDSLISVRDHLCEDVSVILVHCGSTVPCLHDMHCPVGRQPYCTQCDQTNLDHPCTHLRDYLDELDFDC